MSPKKIFLIIVLLNLFIFGTDTKFATTELQTADTLTWVIIQTESGPQPRTNHAMVQLQNGQILLFGGVDTNGTALNDTWLYTPHLVGQSTRNKNHHTKDLSKTQLADWSPITPPNSPSAREGHSMVTLPDGRVLLYGGTDDQGAWFNDLHAFNGDNWESITPGNDPPPGRANHNAWVRNDKLYAQGGFGPSLFEDFWRYDINTNLWEQLESPPDFISPHSFPMVIGGMIVFVDFHSFIYNDGKLFHYDMDQMLWGEQQLTNWPPFSRSFYEMVQDNESAYMLGGATWDEINQKNVYSNEVWKFDYSSLSWSQETSMPYAVYDGAAVYDQLDDLLIYWGGRLNNEILFPAEHVMAGHWGSPPVDISSNEVLPNEFSLEQNYPNPFNPSTTIEYTLPNVEATRRVVFTTLKIYDILGREITTLVNEYQLPGRYNIEFNVEKLTTASLPSGIYFYTLRARDSSSSDKSVSSEFQETKKMMLIK